MFGGVGCGSIGSRSDGSSCCIAATAETFLAAELDEILAPPCAAKLNDLTTVTAPEELVLTPAFEPEDANTEMEEFPLLVPLPTSAPAENPLPIPRAVQPTLRMLRGRLEGIMCCCCSTWRC
jgi:hypothetical protein